MGVSTGETYQSGFGRLKYLCHTIHRTPLNLFMKHIKNIAQPTQTKGGRPYKVIDEVKGALVRETTKKSRKSLKKLLGWERLFRG